jgi:hypothetical protein
MTDETDAPAVLAQDVFDADLLPRPGGRVLRALRLAGAFGAQLLQQLVPSPSVHDVVVTRRSDGTEVLREPAGDPLSAGDMLAGIRRDLATLDPDTFLAQWESRTTD